MRTNLIVFACLVFSLGCDRKSKSDSYILKPTSCFYSIDTKGSIDPQSKHIYFYTNDNKSWLFYGNREKNQLFAYNYPNGNIDFVVSYQERGPNGIGKFRGAFIQNFDSIFICSHTYYNSFFLTDTSGQILIRYNLKAINDMLYAPPIQPIYSHINNEWNLDRNTINLGSYIFTDIENSDVYKEIISIEFDLEKNSIVEYQNFPNLDRDLKQDVISYSRSFNGKEYVYSFSNVPEVFIYNKISNSYQTVFVKSKYQKKSLNWDNNRFDPIVKQKENTINNPRFLSIFYDEYRGCYYHFFKPGYNLGKSNNIAKFYDYIYQFSIIILDENFNILGETLMPPQTYDPFMCFISPEGLYLGLHYDHPLYNPDSLMFEKFDLAER